MMATKRAAKKAPVKPVESGRHDGVRKPAAEVLADLEARGLANDVSVITSGNPHRIARRAKNKIVGRAMARAGLWRLLWGR